MRDQFAMWALNALLQAANWQSFSVSQIVAVAYEIADLMVIQSTTTPATGTPAPLVEPIPIMK